MRIISLRPACTEWAVLFGAADNLVGRSQACDYPPFVLDLPVVEAPKADCEGSGTGDAADATRTLFGVHVQELARLQPDLVLTQTTSGDGAGTVSELRAALEAGSTSGVDVLSLDAATLKEVLDGALALGRRIGRTEDAMRAIGTLEQRLHHLRRRLGSTRQDEAAPTVAVLDSLDPLTSAGHWTPDLIELAGGSPVCSSPGSQSVSLSIETLQAVDADVIVLAPSSLTLAEAAGMARGLLRDPTWTMLRAVKNGRLFVCDGRAYFNRPGPRLYRSIELLAAAIHGASAGVSVRSDEMIRLAR